MTVSVCMIVRNEAANLPDCLESVIPFADEIIINDTGSIDGTQHIPWNVVGLDHKKVKVIENIWDDNFSLARNQGLDAATCRWIMYLDADDRVTATEAGKINRLKQLEPDRAIMFQVKNAKSEYHFGSVFSQIRMFPNRPGLRFRLRVHEQISLALREAGVPVDLSDVQIIHTGYSVDIAKKKEKAARNLKLMSAEEIHNPVRYTQQAEAESMMGDHDKAISWFIRAMDFENVKTGWPDVYNSLASRIAGEYMQIDKHALALRWLERSPDDNIEACYQRAQCYEALKEWQKAIFCYYEVLTKKKTYSVVSIEYDACRIHAYHALARLLICSGKNKASIKIMHELAETYETVSIHV